MQAAARSAHVKPSTPHPRGPSLTSRPSSLQGRQMTPRLSFSTNENRKVCEVWRNNFENGFLRYSSPGYREVKKNDVLMHPLPCLSSKKETEACRKCWESYLSGKSPDCLPNKEYLQHKANELLAKPLPCLCLDMGVSSCQRKLS